MRFVWLLLLLPLALGACGDDDAVADGGADLAVAICQPELPTCTGSERCGAPCDSTKQKWCTNHACFEPYVCQCWTDHWICQVAGRSCDMAIPPGPSDLGPSD